MLRLCTYYHRESVGDTPSHTLLSINNIVVIRLTVPLHVRMPISSEMFRVGQVRGTGL
jgi:hypothetical protein